jgi:hypothetical protein
MAVDCDPWDVLTALHQVEDEGFSHDDGEVDEAGTVVTMTEGYDIWRSHAETGEVRTRGGLQVRSVYTKGGYEDMTKRPYQKSVLTRLGSLRELTKYYYQNQNGQ